MVPIETRKNTKSLPTFWKVVATATQDANDNDGNDDDGHGCHHRHHQVDIGQEGHDRVFESGSRATCPIGSRNLTGRCQSTCNDTRADGLGAADALSKETQVSRPMCQFVKEENETKITYLL